MTNGCIHATICFNTIHNQHTSRMNTSPPTMIQYNTLDTTPSTPNTPHEQLVARINDALPQTQCTQCGYTGCAPYARAIVFEGININQCPPGGAAGIALLSQITGRPIAPLNPQHGFEMPRHEAKIIEADCIGCTKCIQACPVDAIIGTSKHMHTVLTDLCTGCGLCVPPCPVDCIEMPLAQDTGWTSVQAQQARGHFEFRNVRLVREKEEKNSHRLEKSHAKHQQQHIQNDNTVDDETQKKQAIVAAALARARARRQ